MTCPSIGLKRGLVRDEKQLYNAFTIHLTIMFKQGKPYFVKDFVKCLVLLFGVVLDQAHGFAQYSSKKSLCNAFRDSVRSNPKVSGNLNKMVKRKT